MKKILLRSLLVIPLFILTVAASLLCIPSAATWMISTAAHHFLGHHLTISDYSCSASALRLKGTFDDNSTLSLEVLRVLHTDRSATIFLQANTRLFSKITDSRLPNLPFRASLHYRHRHAVLNAALLSGSLHADLNLTDSRYRYRFEALRIESFLKHQHLPGYADGNFNGNGSGQLKAGASHIFNVTSNNMNLHKVLINRPNLPALPSPMPLRINAHLSFVNGTLLTLKAAGDTPVLDMTVANASYDLNSGALTLETSLHNTGIDDIPFTNALLNGKGTYLASQFRAKVSADIDTFRIQIPQLFMNPKGVTTLEYRLLSLTKNPINLMKNNAIFGSLEYTPSALLATAKTVQMPEPLTLKINDANLTVILNNMPLRTLSSIANWEHMPTGHLHLHTVAELNGSSPAVKLHVSSSDFQLPPDIAADLNQTGPASIDLTIQNDKENYVADLIGHALKCNDIHLRAAYHPRLKRINIQGGTGPLTLPGYFTPKLLAYAVIDLNSSTLTRGALDTEFESLRVPSFRFTAPMKGELNFALARLDRFALSPQTRIEGNATVHTDANMTSILLNTNGFGRFHARLKPSGYCVRGHSINVAHLFKLLDQSALFDGDLALSADGNLSGFTLNLASASLTPLSALNRTMQPFPLQAKLKLAGDRSKKSGSFEVKTANETLKLDIHDIHADAQSINTDYTLDINETARSTLYALRDLPSQKLTFSGTINVQKTKQSLTLVNTTVLLGSEIRQWLEENASRPLPLSIEANLSHRADTLVLSASARNPALCISPLRVSYDIPRNFLNLRTQMLTDKWLGNTRIDFKGFVDQNGSVDRADVHVTTLHQSLTVSGLSIDQHNSDYSGLYSLELHSMRQQNTVVSPAFLSGRFQTKPLPLIRLSMHSSDSNLSALMNEDRLYVDAQNIDLSQITDYVDAVSHIKSGSLDADAILDAHALLEGNFSLLGGGIDIKARNVVVEGIELDAYLSTLRDTQDLSLFQGSLSDMPLIRNVKEIPKDLTTKRSAIPSSTITRARFALAVHEGMVVCEDCALSTPKHRLAFAGDVDLPNERFNHFYVALLNPQGCAYFTQQIKGELTDPKIDILHSGVKVIGGAVISLASNVTDAATMTTSLVDNIFTGTGEALSYIPLAGKSADSVLTTVGQTLHQTTASISECIPFYIGSIAHPNPPKKTN